MIELFIVGTIISVYKHNKLIEKEYSAKPDTIFDRKKYILAHLHNIIWTLLLFAIIIYTLKTLSMLLNYFEYENNAMILENFLQRHLHFRKFHTQFLKNITKVVSFSTIIQILFVILLFFMNNLKEVNTKEKAKFELILSTVVSIVSIVIIIIYVL